MGIGNRFERLVHALDAHTIKANLALLRQVIEDTENLWHIIDF